MIILMSWKFVLRLAFSFETLTFFMLKWSLSNSNSFKCWLATKKSMLSFCVIISYGLARKLGWLLALEYLRVVYWYNSVTAKKSMYIRSAVLFEFDHRSRRTRKPLWRHVQYCRLGYITRKKETRICTLGFGGHTWAPILRREGR